VERACAQEIPPVLGDGARACLVLWERLGDDLPALLRGSGWGRHIESIGLGPDLEICAQLDATNVVPVMAGGRIALEEPGSSLKD
jgi:2-phosphosulfolactate phosphatase